MEWVWEQIKRILNNLNNREKKDSKK
jgi:hypothetical protein